MQANGVMAFVTFRRIIIHSLFLLSIFEVNPSDGEVSGRKRNVLVFGGNGFLGSATVVKLLAHGDDVTIVNRGTWYWDSKHRVHDHVTSLKCDRSQPLLQCSDFATVSAKHWDFVIDFSAYKGFEVEQAVGALKGKTKLYIYISSDSVYEVCIKSHKGPTQEKDAVRPDAEEERERLNSLDSYGDGKLRGEEALYAQRWHSGMPFMALRLPDVIGPRDNTHRFWIYQLLIKVSQIMDFPVVVPEFLQSYPLSLVSAEDVADLIIAAMNMGPQVYDQAVNLAFPAPVTLPELLRMIGGALGIPHVPITFRPEQENPTHYYPSVRRGSLDVTKAENLFLWQPSSLSDVVKKTVQFYEDAMVTRNFSQQSDEVIQAMTHQLFPQNSRQFHEAIEKAYTIALLHSSTHTRDEL